MQLVPKDIASVLGQCYCGAKIISFEDWPLCPDGCDFSGLTDEQDNPDEGFGSEFDRGSVTFVMLKEALGGVGEIGQVCEISSASS